MQLGRQGSNRNQRANRSSRGRGQDSMSRGAGSTVGLNSSGTPSEPGVPNAFEKERLENAAKRAQREKGTMVNGRGGRGNGPFSKPPSPTTTTPFAQAPAAAPSSFGSAAPATFNPFAPKSSTPSSANTSTSNSNPFGAPPKSEGAVNPFGKPAATTFGAASTTNTSTNPFNKPSSNSNPFGAPSKLDAAVNPFGKPASSPFGVASPAETTTNPFNKPSSTSNPFGAPSNTAGTPAASSVFGAQSSNPWSKPSSGVFGTQLTPSSFAGASTNGDEFSNTPAQSKPSPFGTPSSTSFTGFPSNSNNTFGSIGGNNTSTFGSIKNSFGASNGTSSSPGVFAKPTANGTSLKPSPVPTSKPGVTSNSPMFSKPPSSFGSPAAAKPAANSLAAKVEQQLKKDRIVPPPMPTYDLMFERQLLSIPEMFQHLQNYKAYQDKVRSSLMKAGLIDDPEKPKSLKDAIDFKGTCEEMCPEFEKIERLVESRVDVSEKGIQPDGTPTRHAVMDKMVKILARSSAGQSAPLPSEVRTTAALRRTVDYLMKDVLTEANISKVHGFLWNRTRAIRRDFVFHSFMSPPELVDQVYCLETIARFHTISLHLMSKPENYSETFDTHQEFEQLGNTMISLMQAYGDCKANGVVCKNEAEFRAYLVVIQRKSNPGLLEMVHSWGWDLFEAKEVKIALAMAEALGNNWDMHGPLKPTAPTDIAQNAFSRFFDIVEDKNTSYTMACFAEIWFNDAREAIVRTILASYRKQRNQIKDWTVPVLNEYLRFDDENDVIPWCEARDIVFEEADGLTYLSMEPGNNLNHIEGKQYHSQPYVEKKRGNHSLQHVLYNTVYEEAGNESPPSEEEEEGLFVKQSDPVPKPIDTAKASPSNPPITQGFGQGPDFPASTPPPVQESQPKPASLFDRIGTPNTFDGFTDFSPAAVLPSVQPPVAAAVVDPKPTSIFTPQPKNEAPSIFAKQPAVQGSSIFTKQPVNSTTSFFPSQTTNGTSTFFPKQQVGGEGSFPTQPSPPKEPPGSQAPPTFSFAPTPLTQTVASSPLPAPSTAVPKQVSFFPQKPFSNSPLPATVSTLSQPAPQPQPPPSQPLSGFFGTPIPLVSSHGTSVIGATQSQSNTPKDSPRVPALPPFTTTLQNPAFVAKPASPPFDRFAGLTDWFALGSEGIVEQFTSFQVETILRAAAKQFAKEENVRATREAEESARAEADLFRYRSLATKYGYLWREQAHLRWLKRRGREARKARREMAESFRASKAAQSAAVVEDFRASTTKQRQGSLESLLGATGILNGVHDAAGEVGAIVQEDRKPSHRRQRSQRSERSMTSQSSTASKHKRVKSENPLRRSLMSDPTYLQGGSRIHLLSDRSMRDEQHRPQVSGVQTDYFRLKARGISTLHDGTPLANSAVQNMLKKKRSFDGFIKPATPQQSKQQTTPRSVPIKRAARPEMDGEYGDQVEDVEVLKARARAVMSGRKDSGQKRSFDDEDEDLFARAKRIREMMEEGEEYYRRELERESGSRSTS
ncbi:SAC3/GANP/Nin1/mts3/eIF-3 p25 family-domain-containing protein [Leptodontidium sp. MPI-SDFR-AT-0119]|nr:SAC3/GANP/Nin1/mts3/eIF-3 p25 family-domain-containing protein [Leptodontidium sp. MPI-SDFR-AT-0119]